MRYYPELLIRILLCFVPVAFFYWLFGYPTIYGSYLLLHGLAPTLQENVLFVGSYIFQFVEACIAPSAYYLLWLLVFLVKDLPWKKRVLLVVVGFALLLLMNILRIAALVYIAFHYGEHWFDLVHLTAWKIFSGAYVVVVWIFLIHVFKVKSIPIVDDFRYIYHQTLFRKKRH